MTDTIAAARTSVAPAIHGVARRTDGVFASPTNRHTVAPMSIVISGQRVATLSVIGDMS